MKKTICNIKTLAALLLMGTAVMTSCGDDEEIVPQFSEPTEVEQTAKTYTMTVVASKGEEALTKVLTLIKGTNTLRATWAVNDKVTVYNVTKSADLTGTLTAQTSGSSVTLSGTLTGTIEENDELTLKFCSNDYTSQDGTLEYIAANCDYATATVTVASVSDDVITIKEGSAEFTNQQAIVKFTLTSDGTTTINASQLTVTADGTSYTVTPTSATSEFYVAIPGISGKTVSLSATEARNNYTYIYEKSGVTFTNGKYYTITVKKMVRLLSVTVSDGGTGAGDHAIYYVAGETWAQAIDNHSSQNSGWATDEVRVRYRASRVYPVKKSSGNYITPDQYIDSSTTYTF